jgi:hypothetical protein
MRPIKMFRSMPLILATVLATGSIAACGRPVEYGDAVFGDRHRWDSREDEAYRRWEGERRFDHVEFARRPAADQSAYWTWRHAHP